MMNSRMKYLDFVIGAVVLLLVIGFVATSPKLEPPAMNASQVRLGPPLNVCTRDLVNIVGTKLRWEVNCKTLRTGMTKEQVKALLGDYLPGPIAAGENAVQRSAMGDDILETWRYFGRSEHPTTYVVLSFRNDYLEAIDLP